MENTLSRVKYLAIICITLFLYAGIFFELRANPAAAIELPPLQQQVTGKVTDENGIPIPGVTIRLKNTNIGTVTDSDGNFSLPVGEHKVLVFSYIGMLTVEEPLNDRDEINIQLKEDVDSLGEVEINAGYYHTTRRESTGNISRVTSEEIELQPIVSPIEALQGRMAGVEIFPNTSHAGATSTIRIRGTNSLREDGNYPLYIINGIPVNSTSIESIGALGSVGLDPLSTIDLSDIESIEVLKDADATAIYGSRGANGVVLISTKNGRYGKKGLEARVYTGASTVPNHVDLMNTEQYLQIRRQAFHNDLVEPTDGNAYDLTVWDQNRYTDWQDYFFGNTSNITDINVASSGGSENTTFRIGGSYRKQGSVYLGDFDYQKVTGNLNLNHLSENKKLSIQLALNYGIDNNNLGSSRMMEHHAFYLPPNAPAIFLEDGSLNWEDWTAAGLENPMAGFFDNSEVNTNNFISSLGLSYEILDGFTIKSSFGYTSLNNIGINIRPKRSYNPANWGTFVTSSSHIQNYRKSWIIEPQLVYHKKLGAGELDAVVGVTFQDNESSTVNFQARGYVSDALIGNLSAADALINGSSQNSKYRYNALFGRVGYNWDDKYILNLTGRRDGSSRFGPGKKIANFWAVGGAWIFTDNSNNSFLSFGKIRGSYGTTGNDQIGDYGYLDAYEATLGPGGLYPTQLANPDYSWEVNKKLEAGVELSFFNDRMELGVSWYRNRSSNQLVGYALPALTGFASIQANLPATVQNKGLEVVLSSLNFQSENFSWRTSFNMSVPKNELVSYPDLDQSSYANTYRIGHPLNISLLYQYDGIDSETGLYTFQDVNEDGRINIDDRVVVQDFGKQLFGGINNNIRYRNFSLQFFLDFVKQEGTFNYFDSGAIGNQHVMAMGALNDTDYFQKVSSSTAARTAFGRVLNSELPIQNASFLRLKSLSLTYSLPKAILDVIGLQNGSVFFTGHNLFTVTNYEGLDPEIPQVGNYFSALRTLSGGLSLNL